MENEQENQTNSIENQCPSFFQNSSTGIGFSEAAASAEHQQIAVDPVVTSHLKPGFHMIITVGDALPRQARGHFKDGCIKWKHILNDVADQTRTVRGRIERVEFKAWFP